VTGQTWAGLLRVHWAQWWPLLVVLVARQYSTTLPRLALPCPASALPGLLLYLSRKRSPVDWLSGLALNPALVCTLIVPQGLALTTTYDQFYL